MGLQKYVITSLYAQLTQQQYVCDLIAGHLRLYGFLVLEFEAEKLKKSMELLFNVLYINVAIGTTHLSCLSRNLSTGLPRPASVEHYCKQHVKRCSLVVCG